jgi:hypothetical protein
MSADLAQLDDLGGLSAGHVCAHGVRWPHQCDPCDSASWATRPPPDLIDAIVAQVARRHPNGGNQLCQALREAAELGWRAANAHTTSQESLS